MNREPGSPTEARTVGPVLRTGEVATAVVAALRTDNPALVVQDHGAYLRAVSPGRCVLSRDRVETLLGRPFVLPGDLEEIMPSFKGRFAWTEDGAAWTA